MAAPVAPQVRDGVAAASVEVIGLRKTFGQRQEVRAVDDISLTIDPGELLVLLGPSGCGKTTLLRCVAGLERPDGGQIVLNGRRVFDSDADVQVPTHKRDIGMVFQNYALWPHMSVLDNVAYPLRWRGLGRRPRGERARQALRLVECEQLADRLPAALSGGQQQRVALARAIVAEPSVMLFDEPLSNLDFLLRGQLRAELRKLHREIGFTGVYVTHDQVEALQLGTRVAVIRDGRVEQIGDPTTVFTAPASPYVAEFLGVENRLRLVRRGNAWTLRDVAVDWPSPVEVPGDEADLYLRAADVRLCPPNTAVGGDELVLRGGRTVDVVYTGQSYEVAVDFAGTTMYAKPAQHERRWNVGDEVDACFVRSRALFYAVG